MTTQSQLGGMPYCDKCGRLITPGKGYIEISGWKICGICQYEDQQKNQLPKQQ